MNVANAIYALGAIGAVMLAALVSASVPIVQNVLTYLFAVMLFTFLFIVPPVALAIWLIR